MTYELWHLGGQSGYRDTTKFGHFLTHNAVCSELSKWLIENITEWEMKLNAYIRDIRSLRWTYDYKQTEKQVVTDF